mmetsp:Transcript_18304/g.23736  ORF Transcript_18304/g.23736 Transcript_18304/m.23736 type:complete len:335 (+) Transcript_18304:67-1071(+)
MDVDPKWIKEDAAAWSAIQKEKELKDQSISGSTDGVSTTKLNSIYENPQRKVTGYRKDSSHPCHPKFIRSENESMLLIGARYVPIDAKAYNPHSHNRSENLNDKKIPLDQSSENHSYREFLSQLPRNDDPFKRIPSKFIQEQELAFKSFYERCPNASLENTSKRGERPLENIKSTYRSKEYNNAEYSYGMNVYNENLNVMNIDPQKVEGRNSAPSGYCDLFLREEESVVSDLTDEVMEENSPNRQRCSRGENFYDFITPPDQVTRDQDRRQFGLTQFQIQAVEETYKAIGTGNACLVWCPCCNEKLAVSEEAEYVLCSNCESVFQISPQQRVSA